MKLKDWRLSKDKTMQAVADEMNAGQPAADHVSQSSIDRWEKGTIPRQDNIRRIAEITDHQVTFVDFYEEPKPVPRRHPASRVRHASRS